MPGWGDKEFQKALEEDSLRKHEVQVQFDKERTLLAVYQYYNTKVKQVQCCIIPNEVISLDRAPSMKIEINTGECILVWPNQHADVYNSTTMTFIRKLGKILFHSRIWQQLFSRSLYEGSTDIKTVDDSIDENLQKLKEATHGP